MARQAVLQSVDQNADRHRADDGPFFVIDWYFGANGATQRAVLLDHKRLAAQGSCVILGDRSIRQRRILQRTADQLAIGVRVTNQLAIADHHEAQPGGLAHRFGQRLDAGGWVS